MLSSHLFLYLALALCHCKHGTTGISYFTFSSTLLNTGLCMLHDTCVTKNYDNIRIARFYKLINSIRDSAKILTSLTILVTKHCYGLHRAAITVNVKEGRVFAGARTTISESELNMDGCFLPNSLTNVWPLQTFVIWRLKSCRFPVFAIGTNESLWK